MLIGRDIFKALKEKINSEDEVREAIEAKIPWFTRTDKIRIFPNKQQVLYSK